jgi:NADH:ubiquinone oxidoreductase subunit F (NADH-binding)
MTPRSSAVLEDVEPMSQAPVPSGLPRLLFDVPPHGAMSLSEHLRSHGSLPAANRRRGRETEIIDHIEEAGLRGRGGAGFSTARKMRAVASARKRPVVVVNATEGEPASRKDRTLISSVPHLVIDGAVLAASALGADEVLIGVCETAGSSYEELAQAVAEREVGRSRGPRVEPRIIPSGYVAGQESALISHLNGGPGLPTFSPPLPFEKGVGGRPTFVSNVETFAHIALICRHGPAWFRELGTVAEPGSSLVTLSGPVAQPGVYEIESGLRLSELQRAAGGLTARPLAALVGGYGGTWIGAAHLDELTLCHAGLGPHEASLGAGVLALLGADACPVAETARILRWLSGQSAGQCGPCVHGLGAIASEFEALTGGTAPPDSARRLERLAAMVVRRGACGHPDGTARLLRSALRAFPEELADHARHGVCDACLAPPQLPLPGGGR